MNYRTVQVNIELSSFNFYQFEPHGFICSELCWHIQHEFSDCRSDIICIWYNYNFLTKGCRKIKSKQFSEFGTRTICTVRVSFFSNTWPRSLGVFDFISCPNRKPSHPHIQMELERLNAWQGCIKFVCESRCELTIPLKEVWLPGVPEKS